MFLKDAWRPSCENVETEGNVLRKLAAAKVASVPTYVCGDELNHSAMMPYAEKLARGQPGVDLGHHETNGRRYSKRLRNGQPVQTQGQSFNRLLKRVRRVMPELRHYRLVVEQVCMPLTDFKNGKQFMSVLRDCVQGACYSSWLLSAHDLIE